MQRYHLIKKSLHPCRLGAAKVAFAALHTHNFAGAGDIEPGARAFVCFKLWHFPTSLSLLFLLPWV
jgi:hypothetical protein